MNNRMSDNSTHLKSEHSVVRRTQRGDGVKFILILFGVLSILCIAVKTWVWHERPQDTLTENETLWEEMETDAPSPARSYEYLPGKHDRHNRIHRDYFVLFNEVVSHDANDVQLR